MAGMPPIGGPPGLPGPGAGAPPPGPPPPPPPAPPPGIAPKPPTPFANLTDMPSELSGGWQLVDGACRQLKLIIRHPDFATKPKLVALFSSVLSRLTEILSHSIQSGDGGGAPTSVASESSEKDHDAIDAHFVSADADTTPPQDSGE